MGPKVNKLINNQDENTNVEPVKAKRGRKSKKELIAALNMETIIKDNNSKLALQTQTQNIINLSVSEIETNANETNANETNANETNANETNTNETNTNETNTNETINNKANEYSGVCNIQLEIDNLVAEEPKITKKRGRKPKGGKIIQQIVSNEPQKEDKQNVILHLKCSMKDLQNINQDNGKLESYNFLTGKHDLGYELIGNENINKINVFNDTTTTAISTCYDSDDYDDETICKDTNKEIWKKLKQLEHNLHINNVNNKRSACFWDTCEFDNPPVYIPKQCINGIINVYGCFCSTECAVAYLMEENIDSSTKFERYHELNHIYAKIYNYKKNIKPAPNPYYMLDKYYGNLTIQEYRSLLRNERLFLIVDKPLTRILPELHEDNDDFILNNKIIPSNNYHVKARLQRKKQNKSAILSEKFGSTIQLE